MPVLNTLKIVDPKKCEMEGPYECPNCNGHICLDATFIDQVRTGVICPYCYMVVKAPVLPSDQKRIYDATHF